MKNLLHIENNNIYIKAIKSLANTYNFNVINSKSLSDTKKIILENNIDIIISNLEIEDGDIFELINFLKDYNNFENIPIIVLSANENFELKKKLFEQGVTDFITKDTNSTLRINEIFSQFTSQDNLLQILRGTEIAVVDDDIIVRKIFKSIFKASNINNVTFFENGEDFLNCKKNFLINIIDVVLPDIDWNEIFLSNRLKNKITISISGISNYRIVSSLLINGIDDFIQKPFDTNIFLVKLKKILQVYLLKKELEGKNKKLHFLASTDSLTKLLNHNTILKTLEKRVEESHRYKEKLSIAMLDIDFFKKINDTYGHQIGDEVLIELSKTISSTIRKSDIFGRYGGEEFLLILPKSNIETSKIVIKKILNVIRNKTFSKNSLNITISAGIASITPEDNFINLIKRADIHLYEAKNSGRDKFISD